MSTQTDTVLTLTRVIPAAPDAVFRAWTEPERLKQWSAPEGMTVTIADIDLKVGGRLHIRMQDEDGQEFNAVGVYQEIDRPRRLVYTWRWQEPDHDIGDTLITVEFSHLDSATEVQLRHERLVDAERCESHRTGWASCLNRFEALFAG